MIRVIGMERVEWEGLGERQQNGVGERCQSDRVCVYEDTMSSEPQSGDTLFQL